MSKRKPPVAHGLNDRPDFSRLLPVCVLLSVSLWLLSDTVLAESPYHVAPKIAPRSRNDVRTPAPERRIEPAAAQAKAPHAVVVSPEQSRVNRDNVAAMPVPVASPRAAEAPAVDEAGILPVSYPAETPKPQQATPAPKMAEPVQAKVTKTAIEPVEPAKKSSAAHPSALKKPEKSDLKPKTAPSRAGQPQSKIKTDKAAKPAKKAKDRQARGKKVHPVVIAPEPLLPSPDIFAPAAQGKVSANPAAYPKVQATTPKSGTPSVPAVATNTNSTSPVKPAVSTTWTTSRPRGGQPASRVHAWEPGFYPVGYTPAVRPVTPEKMQALGDAMFHYNRGVYYAQRQQWDAAVSEYRQVLSRNKNMADAYVGLSTAAIYQKDWENALKNGVMALRLKDGFIDPANITQARYNLSSVYCVADDYKQARRYYKLVQKNRHPQAETLWSFLQSNCNPKRQPKPY